MSRSTQSELYFEPLCGQNMEQNGDANKTSSSLGPKRVIARKEPRNGGCGKVEFTQEDHDTLETEVFIMGEAETPDEEENQVDQHDCCSRLVEKVEILVHDFFRRHKKILITVTKVVILALYISYFGYCVHYRYYDEGSYMLTAITAGLVIKIVADRLRDTKVTSLFTKCQTFYETSVGAGYLRKFLRYGVCIAALAGLCVYLGINVLTSSPQNGQAVLGTFCLLLFCFVFSYKPSRVNWHTVIWGFIIQFVFATLTLRTEIGYGAFKWLGDLVHGFVRLSDRGSEFVFGDMFKANKAGFFLDSAGVIIFFNSFIFMLEYYGVLEFIVLKVGGALGYCLETGPVESVVAAANIFIGLAEAPLLIRPFLPTVTRSEIHAIMTCGFASISGAFMAMFIKVGAPASHLLTAAVISAPAALAISKLMYPETERVNYKSQRNIRMKDDNAQRNSLQACSDGAGFSIKLVASIMVNMVAFVSLLNLVNTVLVWVGARAGIEGMTFEWLCSYLLYPLSFVMGTHPQDCGRVGALIGFKMLATPFVAYADLGQLIANRHAFEEYTSTTNGTWHWSGNDVILEETNTTLVNGFMMERSEVIATYALCGISAFPALGFSLGTLIPMCPQRKPDVVRLNTRAFIAGNLANIVTGAVAGVMFTD